MRTKIKNKERTPLEATQPSNEMEPLETSTSKNSPKIQASIRNALDEIKEAISS